MPRPVLALAALVAALALVAGGCSSDDDQAEPTSTTTESTGSTTDGGSSEPSDPDSEYCTVASEIRDTSTSVAEDPDTALEQLERLGAAAPPELEGDFEQFTGTIRQLSEVPEDDPAAIAEVIGLLIEPELQAASDAIDGYTRDTCGFGIDAGEG